jgi:hypothetical protein
LKQQSSELFKRKIAEADEMPAYADVEKVMTNIDQNVPKFLDDLEEEFGPAGTVNVASEKDSAAAQKYVNTLDSKSKIT